VKWFKIGKNPSSGSVSRLLTDEKGNEIAGFGKNMLTKNKSCYITIKQQGHTMIAAMLKKDPNRDNVYGAIIFLYDPPVRFDSGEPVVVTSGQTIIIQARGDIMSKKFDFMMGNPNPIVDQYPYKIAQVLRKFNIRKEDDTYFLEVGPNVDIAFMCICVYALDEMFHD